MDYTLLTGQQQQQIALRKLVELEAEHAGLEFDVRLAAASGVENDNVVQARAQLELLVQQIAIVTSWVMHPPSEPEIDEEASPNGQHAMAED